MGACIDCKSEEMSDYTNHEDKNVGGCNNVDTNEVMD